MIEEDEATRIANPGPGARYELLVPIASGGMATVYVGRQFGAGGFQRIVAIKRMHPHIAESTELTAMFRDEARIASLIHHPNVVSIIDVYEADGEQLLVMDYVDGVSLGQLRKAVREKGLAFPPRVALRVLMEGLRGLHAAHEQKDLDGVALEVVHRDATPHNILLGTEGSVKVTDFGIARAAERSAATTAGQAKGKFAFMAPEQIAGGQMDRRVDIFAMGVVLWELLVGRPLFRGENDAIIIGQITSGDYTRLVDVQPEVPKALDAIVMQALQPAAQERYPTAAAFADALEAYAPELGGLATPEQVGQLVMTTCGQRIQKRRHQVHEVLGGRTPPIAWGAAPPARARSGSQAYVSFQSGSVSTHHRADQGHDPFEPMPDLRTRPSMVRLAAWIGGGLAAAVVAIVILVLALPGRGTAPAAPPRAASKTPSSASPGEAPPRVTVRIEADRRIVQIRVPEGDDVEIAGHTATFTAARGERAVDVIVRLDDGSELDEAVVPTANAVIKVRSATASAPAVSPSTLPKATAPRPASTGKKGPRFQDNPYE